MTPPGDGPALPGARECVTPDFVLLAAREVKQAVQTRNPDESSLLPPV